jgi:hypothetical protein
MPQIGEHQFKCIIARPSEHEKDQNESIENFKLKSDFELGV